MQSLGYAALQVIPSMKGFEGKVASETSGPLSRVGGSSGEKFGTSFAGKASTKMHEKFSETAKYIIGPLVGAFAVEKVGELIGESIRGAVENAAATNRVKLIFGKASEEVGHFSDNAARSYGVADTAARSAAAGFGILFKQAKLSGDENAKSSVQMVKLSADLAAFGHTDFQTAFTAVQKGLSGSTRGLKQYGILIDSAQQKAEALRLGLLKPVKDQAKIHAAQVSVLKDQVAYNDAVKKHGSASLEAQSAQAKLGTAQEGLKKAVEGTVPALTAQQKVLANQSLIMQQTKAQQGQFGRSQGDLAQQQKILSATWDNAKDRLGKGLLPIVTEFVGFLSREAIPKIDGFSKAFEEKGAPAIKHFVDGARPLAHSLLPAIGTGFKDIGGFLKDAAPHAKAMIDAFNSLPDWAKKTIVLGAGAGYIAKKTGLLSVGRAALTGGGGGGLGSIISGTKPVPVFVVNEGFAGGGGGAVGGAKGFLKKAIPGVTAGGEALTVGGALSVTAIAGIAAAAAFVTYKEFKFGAGATPDTKHPTGSNLTPAQQLKLDQQRITRNFGLPDPFAIDARIQARSPKNDPLRSTATKADALTASLGKTSQALDTVGRAGERNYGALTRQTHQYASELDRLRPTLRTKVDLDTRQAERDLAVLRAHAGRHIPVELQIELAGPGGRQAALDGVRRP